MNIANDRANTVAQAATDPASEVVLLDYQAPTLTWLNLADVVAGAGGSSQYDDDFSLRIGN